MASAVPSDQLLVRDLPDGVEEEYVELFFESARYCPDGGTVKEVEMLGNGKAVITFEEPEVVERLLGQKLVMDNCTLTIERYIKGELNYDDDRKSESSCDDDTKEPGNPRQDCDEYDHDDSDDDDEASGGDLACNDDDVNNNDDDDLDDHNSYSQVKRNHPDRTEDLDEVCDNETLENNLHDDKLTTKNDMSDQSKEEEEFNDAVSSMENSGNSAESDDVQGDEKLPDPEVTCEKKVLLTDEAVAEVTCKKEVLLTDKAVALDKNNADVEEKTAEMQTVEVKLRQEQIRLIKMLSDAKAKVLPHDICQKVIKYDIQNGKILLSEKADDAKLELLIMASSMSHSRLEHQKPMMKLLLSDPGAQWLQEKFLEKENYAILYLKDDQMHLVALDDEQNEQACNRLKEIIGHESVKYEDDHLEYLKSDRWNNSVEQLHAKGIVSITTELDKSEIVIDGRAETVSAVVADVSELLKENSKMTKSISLAKGTARLLKSHSVEVEQKVSQAVKQITSQSVQLIYKETSIEFTGIKAAVQSAIDTIDGYIMSVIHERFEVNKPGVTVKDFTEKDSWGEQIIEAQEMKYKCVIEVEECDPVARSGDGGDSAAADEAGSGIMNVLSNMVTGAAKAVYNMAIGSGDSSTNDNSDNRDASKSDTVDVLEFAKNITVQSGSLVDFQADVLVNPIAAKTSKLVKAGAVSKSFYDKGKETLQQEYQNGRPPTDFGGNITVTSNAQVFPCKKIYHVAIRHKRDSKSIHLLEKSITKCLKKAEEESMTSIAFPTLGCGKLLYDVKDVVTCFNKAARQSNLQVFVIGFDQATVDAFTSYLTQPVLKKTNSDSSPSPKAQNASVSPAPASDSKTVKPKTTVKPLRKAVRFHITAMDQPAADGARHALATKVSDILHDTEVKKEVIANIDEDLISKMEKLSLTNGVHLEVDISNKTIRLGGHFKSVDKTKTSINEMLAAEEQNRNDLQYIKKTQGVKAYLLKLGSKEDIGLPKYWTHYKQYGDQCSGTKRTTVAPGTELYKAVEAIFMKTIDPAHIGAGQDATGLKYSTLVIKNIFIIENLTMFHSYLSKLKTLCYKASMRQFNPVAGLRGEAEVSTKNIQGAEFLLHHLVSEVNECYLLHGTSHADVIAETGIDFRFSGDKVLFGKGAYFAEKSTKADQYADEKQNRKQLGEVLHMFVARVLLGEPFVCQDPVKYKKPPCSQCQKDSCSTNGHQISDSVIGTHRNASTRLLFREFVVYHTDQCYPEFLVEYVRQ